MPTRDARLRSRPLLARVGWVAAVAAFAIAALGSAAQAQSDWAPFKERDERAAALARARKPTEAQPLLPPVDRSALSERPGASEGNNPSSRFDAPTALGATTPMFGTQSSGSVEKVELAPLEPVAPQPVAAVPGTPGPLANPTLRPLVQRPGAPAPVVSPAPARPLTQSGRDLPPDLWRGVDMKQLETLIAPLEVPPKSAALHALWSRLLTADVIPPAGGRGQNHYLALQLEALYRSGLITAMQGRLDTAGGRDDDPLLTAFKIRRDLASAATEAACAGTKQLAGRRGALPKLLKGEVHVLSGYCAAVAGNAAAAGLAAELAREEEVDAALAIQVLDAIAAGANAPKPKLQLPKRLMVLDYRLMEQLGPVDPVAVLGHAEPALLYALSQTEGTPPRLAIAAAEAGAGMHALSPDQLGEVYARIAMPRAGTDDPLFRRAQLYQAVMAEAVPARRLPMMRQLIDDGRRSGLGLILARLLAKPMAELQPTPDLGPAAALAAETAIAAGDYERARQFAGLSPQAAVWAPLAELADASLRGVSESALGILEDQVKRNTFTTDALHRLATVLDALDTNVPIPLWEAASRAPQPKAGYLPETGVLPQLQDAAKKQEIGRVALLVMRTIGPAGPDASHLIALGDSIRALRRAGLEMEARLLAMEALYASWPRG